MKTTTTTVVDGVPVAGTADLAPGRRLIGPDLARGGMLLLIALANVHVFAFGHLPGFRGYPQDQPVVDQVFTTAQMLLVDGRAFPLFAALFGYGLSQMAARQTTSRSARAVVGLLRRRGWWMGAIGFAHALLLFTADIVALYGLLAVLLAGVVVRASDRRLLVIAAWLAPLALAVGAARGLPADVLGLTEPVRATPVLWDGGTIIATVAARCTEWAGNVLRVLGLAPAVLLGAWAGRMRVFGTPERAHVLRLVAAGGLILGLAGGVPSALMAASVWDDPPTWVAAIAGALHLASGYAVAAAYVTLFALVGDRVGPRPPWALRAVVHAGQRSLSLYLLQSVLFLAVLDPSLGGLGDDVGTALSCALGVGVWVGCVLMASLMHRLGNRGPAETWLRNRTYGRSRR